MSSATQEAALLDETDLQDGQYADLQKQIDELKAFARPLQKEALSTPIFPVVARIMSLKLHSRDRVEEVMEEVEECRRLLDEIAWGYIDQILAKPEQSAVFKVVNNSNLFEETLKEAIGSTIKDEEGKEIVITPEIVRILTKYKFSIGTPPITEKGIKTLEKILFSGDLKDVYGFRNLLGTRIDVFDRFLKIVGSLVEQSTHYTTAGEKQDFENFSRDFTNLEGVRGFTKTTVTGTAKTATRLIKDHLFSQHRNGSTPLTVKDECDLENPHQKGLLIDEMTRNRSHVFVVKVKRVPHNIFANDVLNNEWKGVIGRLILVEDSEKSTKSATTLVYSINPRITETLGKFHIKDSGAVSNTQLNVRRILEGFSGEDLGQLRAKIDEKIQYFESQNVQGLDPNQARKREWDLSDQKDYMSLKRFRRFLAFVSRIKEESQSDVDDINQELIGDQERLVRQYFFKDLPKDGYDVICIPQGGGREELGIIGKFHLAKHRQALSEFRSGSLTESKSKLQALKEAYGIRQSSSSAERAAYERSAASVRSPNQAIRDLESAEMGHINGLREAVSQRIYQGLTNVEDVVQRVLRDRLDDILGTNIPGVLKGIVSRFLSSKNLDAAAKNLERGGFRELANKLRTIEGTIRRLVEEKLASPIEAVARKGKQIFEKKTLEKIEKIINDIEQNGAFNPRLSLAEMGWSFDDVMPEENFPSQDYIKIEINDDGDIALESLDKKLANLKDDFVDFPELFNLYCGSILLIFNDPHNPTGRIASTPTKLKLLDIASKYGLAIVADEAYHKMITKELKDDEGDLSFATFYEFNKARFPNVKFYTSLPTTKWAFGGGRRTGDIVTNDLQPQKVILRDGSTQELTFEQFARANVDGVNSMSLYMDIEILKTGRKVKEICKGLEEAMVAPLKNPLELIDPLKEPTRVIDEFLAKESGKLGSDEFTGSVYFTLIEARKDLDRLRIREADPMVVEQYVSSLVSKLKELRLDKQTRKDTERRLIAGKDALERVSKEFPELKDNYIEPQGPFYLCVKLDENESRETIQQFAEVFARSRKVDGVSVGQGFVRFSFGGYLDGTDDGYKMLGLAFETDLRLTLQYWKKFKETKSRLIKEKDLNPNESALKELFPGGEIEIVRTIREKKPLLDALAEYKEKGRTPLVFPISSDASRFVSQIEPTSKAEIVTIKEANCQSMGEFVNSRPFAVLFNFYLLKIKDRIPELRHLTDNEIIGEYGVLKFKDKSKTRIFKNGEQEIYSHIAMEMAKVWFSDSTTKVLVEESDVNKDRLEPNNLLGAEQRISGYIEEFLRIFISEEQEKRLKLEISIGQEKVDRLEGQLGGENFEAFMGSLNGKVLRFKPTFQVGFESVKGVTASPKLPGWLQALVKDTEFAAQTVPTDPSPEMVTEGQARVAGFNHGIIRRDGDGKNAPKKEYFRDKLGEFVKTANPKDYVCKLIQVGHVQVLLVMHKSFSHYMAEELRLFPQMEVPMSELNNISPHAVSFMGIPEKVMGDEYKIGYYFDQNADGETIPVTWACGKNPSDYVGYLKKPVLTAHNEKTKEIGGLPIHGSALTVVFKNGLRKTIVIAGDSGTGKSETLIAMVEQIIKEQGDAKDVEAVELLAGDMLSMFEGEDEQMYMIGTEEGDFMRMTDISDDWQKRFRDRLGRASVTNRNHKSNPRATLPGLCDRNTFLRPTRVNVFLVANNYEKPAGSAVEEVVNPRNLMMDVYAKGYRKEKGTSGDQPNLYASVLKSGVPGSEEILKQYGEDLDKILGWNITVAPNGKVENAILSFQDIPNMAAKAKSMVKALFEGKKYKDTKLAINADGSMNIVDMGWEILEVKYDAIKNHFIVKQQGADGAVKEVALNRTVFDGIYPGIASTYGGDPFVAAYGMDEVLSRYADIMKNPKAGIITGVIHTQIGIPGSEFTGTAKAARDLIAFLKKDPRVNERFQKNQDRVYEEIIRKYGTGILGQGELPQRLKAHNLLLLERHESDTIKFVREVRDAAGKVLRGTNGKALKEEIPGISTSLYRYNPEAADKDFNPSLITPETFDAIHAIRESGNYQQISQEEFEPDLREYSHIQRADNMEELIFQIMAINGTVNLGYDPKKFAEAPHEVKKSEIIAEMLIKRRPGIFSEAA